MQWVSTFVSGAEGGAPVYFVSYTLVNCPLRYFPQSHVKEIPPPLGTMSPDCGDVLLNVAWGNTLMDNSPVCTKRK